MEKKKHKESAPEPAVETETGQAPAQHDEAAGADRLTGLEKALAEKEAEAAANWDRFVRERADLENYRKRVQKEKAELLLYGMWHVHPIIFRSFYVLTFVSSLTCGSKVSTRFTTGLHFNSASCIF